MNSPNDFALLGFLILYVGTIVAFIAWTTWRFFIYKPEAPNKKVKNSWNRDEVHDLMVWAWITGEANKDKGYKFRENWIEQNL